VDVDQGSAPYLHFGLLLPGCLPIWQQFQFLSADEFKAENWQIG